MAGHDEDPFNPCNHSRKSKAGRSQIIGQPGLATSIPGQPEIHTDPGSKQKPK